MEDNELQVSQKEEAVRAGQRRIKIQKTTKKLVFFLVLVLIAYGGVKLFGKKVDDNKPTSGTFYEAQSRDHIATGAEHPAYNSNPPTGGWHYATPAQTGIYDKELPDEQLIHNLEHSHIWISYRQDLLDRESVEKLADLAKKYGPKIIMVPRSKNDNSVAITAWQYLLKLDKVDDSTLRQMDDFIQSHRGHAGPENPLDFGFGDFRGKDVPSPTPMAK